MHVRYYLCCPRAVVLHDIVVRYAGDAGDCAGEEGKPETWEKMSEAVEEKAK
jgi:hypothetical protein